MPARAERPVLAAGARASAGPADRVEARVRALCLALPETTEVTAWGVPTFRVRGRMFAMYAPAAAAPGRERPAVWLNERPANQALLLENEPTRYFRPPYVGVKGWIGVWVDAAAMRGTARWTRLAEMLAEAHVRTTRR